MSKPKKINYWYIIIGFILIILAFGYFFELGEAFGKATTN